MSLEEQTREIAAHCLFRRARTVSRRITRLYDDALREVGLTATQMTLLAVVQLRGEASQVELGEVLEMDKSTVSRTVGRMAAHGWLTTDGGNGRLLATTAEGRDLLASAYPRWRQAQERAEELFDAELLAALLAE